MSLFFELFKAIIFGFITGFSLSIPIGPASIESVNRTLSRGFIEGFKVSLGTITADFTILLIVNVGLFRFLINNKINEGLFWIFSGILLSIFMFYKNRKRKPQLILFGSFPKRRYDGFFSGFLMTILNPTSIFLWVTISGTLFTFWLSRGKLYFFSSLLFMFIGSLSWFIILNILASRGVKFLRRDVSINTSKLLSLFLSIIGVLFIIYGLYKIFY
ncbi:MAG: LysE family translocator [Clostridium sp.]